MSIKVASLLRPAPFGLEARFSEQVDGRTWWHHVGVAAFTDEGEPAIIGGKGPGRGNYRLVLASDYRNYGGLVHAGQGLADDDFVDPVLGTFGRQPPRHLVDSGGVLVIRFNPRQLAGWVDDVINDALKLGGSMDDRAREYAQKMAPFTTLTDEEMAALDAIPGEKPCGLPALATSDQRARGGSPGRHGRPGRGRQLMTFAAAVHRPAVWAAGWAGLPHQCARQARICAAVAVLAAAAQAM
jgi:hypothetical protein